MTLPLVTNQKQIASIFHKNELGFKPITNVHVARQVPETLYVLTTAGGCDCGTVVGLLHDHPTSHEDPPALNEAELKKLHKQGWSEGKIQRWLDEKRRTLKKDVRTSADLAERRRTEACKWCDFVTELLHSGLAKRCGLILHRYSGSLESERINIKDRLLIPCAKLTPETIMNMDEDTLYEFCEGF